MLQKLLNYKSKFHHFILLFIVVVFTSCGGDEEDNSSSNVTFEKLNEITIEHPENENMNCYFARVYDKGDSLFVTYQLSMPIGGGPEMKFGYKDYNYNLDPLASEGIFKTTTDIGPDYAADFDGEHYYLLTPSSDMLGWDLSKYNNSWAVVDTLKIEETNEAWQFNDQMLEFINGKLVTGDMTAKEPTSDENLETIGAPTFHHIVSQDLQIENSFILDDENFMFGMSMEYANKKYYLFSNVSYFGDMKVAVYDENWNFEKSKTIYTTARWPQGSVYKDGIFYISFVDYDEDNRTQNIKLMALDEENLKVISEIQITNLERGDEPTLHVDRPAVMIKDDKAYVTYDSLENEVATCKMEVFQIK